MNPESTLADEGPLPDLNQALLDAPTLDRLFRDLAQCTEIVEIIPKFAERRMVAEQDAHLSLEQARELLLNGTARGIQIRYRFEGADWWDTLIATAGGVRLVRIRHHF